MSEDQIELQAERVMDRLDKQFMSGRMVEATYNSEVAKLNEWCTAQYRAIKSN